MIKERNFGEIKSTKDFNDRCVQLGKGCAIALLSAMNNEKSEEDELARQIKMLGNLDANDPGTMNYSWINVTCHPEWLRYFDISHFMIPSLTFYIPSQDV